MNLLLLFFISLEPLATSFLGEHPQLARAISFSALVMTLSSAAFGLFRYRLGRLPYQDPEHIQFRSATLVRSFTATALYAVAAIAARFYRLWPWHYWCWCPLCSTFPCCCSARHN
jgi:uncharacterized membrane protein